MSFLKELTHIVNTGQSRAVILTGNIYDLFFDGNSYVPIIPYLTSRYSKEFDPGLHEEGEAGFPPYTYRPATKGIAQVVYELNNAAEIRGSEDQQTNLERMWSKVSGHSKTLESRLKESANNPVFAIQLLHKLCECSRLYKGSQNNLLTIIEGADMLVPHEEISRLSISDRKRISIIHDWFSEPDFMNGSDSVILLAESRSAVHQRITRLPQVLSVEVPLPDITERTHFIQTFSKANKINCVVGEIAVQTAGLSVHACRQLMLSGDLSPDNIAAKVEQYMISQLGEGVVEFKRPSHTLEDCVGNSRVKAFLDNELIPGFKDGTISGAAVGGPIGGGKTFICEAAASEVGCPVVVLKSIRSKWFGETDAIFERLYRLLRTFNQIMIFVDEADAQFGKIDDGHATERRLTGKIQAMMSDPQLLGKVIWFLMTARIHRLSADIRRPGRMDIIVPILDPEGEDLNDFIEWCFKGMTGLERPESEDNPDWERYETLKGRLMDCIDGYSAAAFASLRRRIQSKNCKTVDEALEIAEDMLSPDISETRLYQTLQAKLNCTRRSLVFGDKKMTKKDVDGQRQKWTEEIRKLELLGSS